MEFEQLFDRNISGQREHLRYTLRTRRPPGVLMPIPEHYAWPSYVKVARIISTCLPDAEVSEDGADRIIRFEYRIEGNLILTIDSEGWSYGFNSRPGTWRSFIEGSLEKVAEYVLQPMLHQGVSVMQPPAMYDFENPPVSLSPMKQRRLSPGR